MQVIEEGVPRSEGIKKESVYVGRAGIALMYLHMAKALTRAQASAVSTSSAWNSGQVSSAAMFPLHRNMWEAGSLSMC